VDASLQEARGLAQALAAESVSHWPEPSGLQAVLERLARERTDLINLGVFDTAGRPVAAATPWPEGLDISDRSCFQKALQTKETVVSELIIGRTMKRPAVIAAAPILDADRRVQGVVTVSLRLDQLARRMLDIGLRPGQALFLTDPRGRLVFHTARLEPSWVVDSGIGLEPRELDEVFEPYARTAAARKIRGLGLGLYICRAIIEAHGGTLRARSQGRGKGTTFLFTLPTRPRSDRIPSVAHPP